MKILTLIKNESGSMMVNAIATSIIMAILSGVVFQQSLTSLKTLRLPRIKAAMVAVESRVRHIALQPGSFTGCNSGGNGYADCNFDITLLTSIHQSVVGCDGPAGCGVAVIAPAFVPATRQISATIVYEGAEMSVENKLVQVVVPEEILQQAQILCDVTTPIFQGFNADGTKNCRALDLAFPNGCPVGTFMTGFNTDTMSYICQTINTLGVNCAANQLVSNVTFNGTGFSYTCAPRPAPSSIWGNAPAP